MSHRGKEANIWLLGQRTSHREEREGGGLQGEGEGIRCCRRLTHSPRIKFATDIYSVAGKNTRI